MDIYIKTYIFIHIYIYIHTYVGAGIQNSADLEKKAKFSIGAGIQ
jgi:hypothetical protein